jgi:hypothetical protein
MPQQPAPAVKLPRSLATPAPELGVFTIVGRAIVFDVTHLFTLFRLTWLPLAALLATQIAVGQMIAQATGATSTDTFQRTPLYIPLQSLGVLLQALPLTAVATSVHRLVYFGDSRPGVYFAFPFGATELRYLAACTAVVTLAALPIVVVAAFTYLTGFALGAAPVVAIPFVLLFFVFVTLRLLILAPQTVATNRLSIRDAFLLSDGHAMALLGLIILGGATVLAGFIALGAVFGFDSQDAYYRLMERPDMFGWLWLPDWDRFMQKPTAEMIAWEFGLSFAISSFIVTCLSFAYLAMKALRDGEHVDEGPLPAE